MVCRMVAEISSIDLVVESRQRMFSRRISLCAASTPATDTPVPGGSASPASGSPSPTGTVRLRYSETYRWPDGLRIRVDEPVDYWPSGWVRTVTASRGAGYADLRFTG